MPKEIIDRRKFLRQSSTGAAAIGTGVLLTGKSQGARVAKGPNDQISVGVIGAGGRGQALMKQIHAAAESHNVKITAICDVWKVNREQTAAWVADKFGSPPKQFSRFGDLLALDDIDAVVIATPDFGHCPILIAALEAGKDAYVEKPMAMDVDHANTALELARAQDRIVQVGTQYRSYGGYIAAAKELATGVLGRISRVSAAANFYGARWARSFSDCKESDVDWQAFLFNRPKQDFDPRLLRRWHFYREFTNGISGLWMSHYVDALHLLTGATYPTSAVAHGGIYVWNDGREHTDTFQAIIEYPEEFLFDWGFRLTNSAGTHFSVHGTNGTLDVGNEYMNPNRLKLSAAGGAKDSGVKETTITPEKTVDHMSGWLECLRTRERPSADIQYGHQHAVATIMAAAALETGQRHIYDRDKRTISVG
jgi:predicted dehydrogenase